MGGYSGILGARLSCTDETYPKRCSVYFRVVTDCKTLPPLGELTGKKPSEREKTAIKTNPRNVNTFPFAIRRPSSRLSTLREFPPALSRLATGIRVEQPMSGAAHSEDFSPLRPGSSSSEFPSRYVFTLTRSLSTALVPSCCVSLVRQFTRFPPFPGSHLARAIESINNKKKKYSKRTARTTIPVCVSRTTTSLNVAKLSVSNRVDPRAWRVTPPRSRSPCDLHPSALIVRPGLPVLSWPETRVDRRFRSVPTRPGVNIRVQARRRTVSDRFPRMYVAYPFRYMPAVFVPLPCVFFLLITIGVRIGFARVLFCPLPRSVAASYEQTETRPFVREYVRTAIFIISPVGHDRAALTLLYIVTPRVPRRTSDVGGKGQRRADALTKSVT